MIYHICKTIYCKLVNSEVHELQVLSAALVLYRVFKPNQKSTAPHFDKLSNHISCWILISVFAPLDIIFVFFFFYFIFS